MKVKHSVFAAMSLAFLVGQMQPAPAQSHSDGAAKNAIAFSRADFGLGAMRAPDLPQAQLRVSHNTKSAPLRAVRSVRPVAFSASTGSAWMHSDVPAAWAKGYRGRGANITVVDSFGTSYRLRGTMSGRSETLAHGGWTRKQVSMVALDARIFAHDFSRSAVPVTLQSGFNIMNLSYGMLYRATSGDVDWNQQEASLISYAKTGNALVVKAAGNDGVAITTANDAGRIDLLSRELIGAQSVIFVGALSSNGTARQRASLASYSNIAGANSTVQDQFLVVGVNSRATGLSGTSFAAPIVSGYAAILKSKFTAASHTQIADQLLDTARRDTIAGYNPALHGQGEASLSRALAPAAMR
jgi:subtilisin family serine protease